MSENNQQGPGGKAGDTEEQAQKGRWRGRMKYVVGALLVAVIGVIGVGAVAKHMHHGGGHHGGWRHGGFERFVDHRADKVLDRIEATDDQRAEVKRILNDASGEMRELYLEIREGRTSLVAALTGPAVDRESIEALRAAQVASMDQASQRMLQALADAAEVLTPEQRAEIAEKLARHHEHHD